MTHPSTSFTNNIKVENTGVKKANKAIIDTLTIVNWCIHNIYIRFVHHDIHKLHEKGLGIIAFPFNHFDKPSSALCIIPLRSITKTIIRVIKNIFNIIGDSIFSSLFSPNSYVAVFVNTLR